MSLELPEELSRGQPGAPEGQPDSQAPAMQEPPPNPAGGKTLIVDANDPGAYARPSAALKDAGPDDQVFVKPGTYEDKIFMVERPILLIGAGRDHVQIFSRRGAVRSRDVGRPKACCREWSCMAQTVGPS